MLQIARVIERAYSHPDYFRRHGHKNYLCIIVNYHVRSVFRKATARYIMDNLTALTLTNHLKENYPPFVKGMHKAFWACVVNEIRLHRNYSNFQAITASDIVLEHCRLNAA